MALEGLSSCAARSLESPVTISSRVFHVTRLPHEKRRLLAKWRGAIARMRLLQLNGLGPSGNGVTTAPDRNRKGLLIS